MHLFLIRHGQSYVNLPDWDGGFIDTELTALGQTQAQRAAAWIAARLAPSAIVSSTMQRAVQTATAIAEALDMSFTTDDRLREIGNAWPDATPVDVSTEAPEFAEFWASEQPFDPIAEGGETWGDFVTRVGRAMLELNTRYPQPDDTVLVVCHGGVINAALDVAFNVGHWRNTDAWVHNTSITHLEHLPVRGRPEMWRLHGVNLAYHLVEPDGSLLGYQWKGRQRESVS